MVFPSIPVYLDPPNWQQQEPSHDDHFIGNGQLGVQLPPPHPTGGSTRPRSLTDQARLAKVPVPEPGLKCPRCESTNTKFCYYNNYSLTQPRHFCKTCRRYWTRGGALRNVPVGGGCRRNKRIKRRSSASKTPSITATGAGGSSALPPASIAPPNLSFMAGSGDYMGGGEVGQISNNNSGSSSGFLLGDLQQWRMQQQQLPYLANFGAPSSLPCGSTLFQFEGGESINNGLNLSRHLVNLPAGNYDHQLSAGWPSHDVSGLFMSSTTHHDL